MPHIVITSKKIFTYLLRSYTGITLWPFVILKHTKDELGEKSYKILLNHERIHLRQQIETLIVFFYILYLYYYIKNRLKGKKHFKAYTDIPFEIESYKYERDLDYLKTRKFWQWRKFC